MAAVGHDLAESMIVSGNSSGALGKIIALALLPHMMQPLCIDSYLQLPSIYRLFEDRKDYPYLFYKLFYLFLASTNVFCNTSSGNNAHLSRVGVSVIPSIFNISSVFNFWISSIFFPNTFSVSIEAEAVEIAHPSP